MSGKEYRFWMTPDALHEFRKIEVQADDSRDAKKHLRCLLMHLGQIDCIAGHEAVKLIETAEQPSSNSRSRADYKS
jgi:hypothetical protein